LYDFSPPEDPGDSIPLSLPFNAEAPVAEHTLLQHYVGHVAALMMPYEHLRNPWKLHYPATALSHSSADQNALYHALLAQSAFNIAQLRGNDNVMIEAGLRHYDLAIRKLFQSIGKGRSEYSDFSALLASIMTLLFVEVSKRFILCIACILRESDL
jgi:hypothetical protein